METTSLSPKVRALPCTKTHAWGVMAHQYYIKGLPALNKGLPTLWGAPLAL